MKILVIGESCRDIFHYGECNRLCPGTPVPVFNPIKSIDNEQLNVALEIKSTLSKSIDEMELSVRSHNCLQAAGIETIGELVSKEESTMLKYKNFGRKSLTELTEKLYEIL